MAIYVVSDLHGCFKTFLQGLKAIAFKETDRLYILGDAIDKGDLQSIQTLQYVMKHCNNMDLIIGNHEHMMLSSLNTFGMRRCDGIDARLWMESGAESTLKDYYSMSWLSRFRLLQWLSRRYVERTIYINEKKICLLHSYYNPLLENRRYRDIGYDDVSSIVWTSIFEDSFTEQIGNIYKRYSNTTFIAGHTPVQLIADYEYFDVYKEDNLYMIDGGCAFGTEQENIKNGIIFLRLYDMKSFPIPIQKNVV